MMFYIRILTVLILSMCVVDCKASLGDLLDISTEEIEQAVRSKRAHDAALQYHTNAKIFSFADGENQVKWSSILRKCEKTVKYRKFSEEYILKYASKKPAEVFTAYLEKVMSSCNVGKTGQLIKYLKSIRSAIINASEVKEKSEIEYVGFISRRTPEQIRFIKKAENICNFSDFLLYTVCFGEGIKPEGVIQSYFYNVIRLINNQEGKENLELVNELIILHEQANPKPMPIAPW
ncbi:MAG: hypothetical protein ACPGXY_00295 [Alphaproteobacteria bacterium]